MNDHILCNFPLFRVAIERKCMNSKRCAHTHFQYTDANNPSNSNTFLKKANFDSGFRVYSAYPLELVERI